MGSKEQKKKKGGGEQWIWGACGTVAEVLLQRQDDTGVCESVNSSQCTGSLHREYTHTHTHTHTHAHTLCCSDLLQWRSAPGYTLQPADTKRVRGVCVCVCVRSTCSNRSVCGVEQNETEMCTLRSAEVLNGGAEAADRTSTGTFIHMIHVRGAHTHSPI